MLKYLWSEYCFLIFLYLNNDLQKVSLTKQTQKQYLISNRLSYNGSFLWTPSHLHYHFATATRPLTRILVSSRETCLSWRTMLNLHLFFFINYLYFKLLVVVHSPTSVTWRISRLLRRKHVYVSNCGASLCFRLKNSRFRPGFTESRLMLHRLCPEAWTVRHWLTFGNSLHFN